MTIANRPPSAMRSFCSIGLILLAASGVHAQLLLDEHASPSLSKIGGTRFGMAVTSVGDLNGNGIEDFAVGAPDDPESGPGEGAVWILFMDAGGSVDSTHKISAATDNFVPSVEKPHIGEKVSNLGDWRGRGFTELAIGRPTVGNILGLQPNGHVAFQEPFPVEDSPEATVVMMGDLDGNGWNDLAESRQNSTTGDVDIVRYRSAATFQTGVRIGGSQLPLRIDDAFGWSLANIGDLDRDGRNELAVGNFSDDDFYVESGAVYILFLNPGGLVSSFQKISRLEGDFRGDLQSGDWFGRSVANLGDLDGDGRDELAVGAPGDAGGAIWILFMNADGTVRGEFKLASSDLGIPDRGNPTTAFGQSISLTHDFNGDGIPDLAVGHPAADAVWILPALADVPSFAQLGESEPSAASVGRDIPVDVAASGVGGVTGVDISFRRGGDLTYFSTEMTFEGGAYHYEIPAFMTSSRGLEYFATIFNRAGKETKRPADGPVSIPLEVPDGVSISVPTGEAATGYRLVSIPLLYDNLLLVDVLEAGLGSSDKSNWRAFAMSQGTVTELEETTMLRPALAFWLLASEGSRVLRPGPGRTLRTDQPLKIRLRKGWNLVGNPFDFPILAGSLSTASDMELDIRSYDGDWHVVNDTLQAREGYAVFSTQVDTLIFDPRPRQSTSKGQRSADASTLDWSVAVRATDSRARDNDNVFGTSPAAIAGWDTQDAAEPPAIGDYISIFFGIDDDDAPTSRLQHDIRPPIDDEANWRLNVAGAKKQVAILAFEGLNAVPLEFDVVLFDPVLNLSRNLRENPTYTLVGGTPDHPRELVVTVGRNASAAVRSDLPAVDVLESFPNPFSNATTIRFALQDPSRTRLSVYDVAGRLVSVLTESDRLEAGLHTSVWDGLDGRGRQVAGGLYFIRLETGLGARSTAVSLSR